MTTPEATYRSPVGPTRPTPYVSSGRTPIVGLAAGLGAGTLVALVLSVLYAYGTLYIPIVQVEFLLTVAFGAAVGASTTGVMHRFHVRSRAVVVGTSLVLGTLAWAVSWLPWLYATMQRYGSGAGAIDVLDPTFVGVAIAQIYEHGTWGIGSSATSNVSGAMLGAVWVCEAATIIGFSTGVSLSMTKGRVFCETCESWCTVSGDLARWDLDHGETLRSSIVERGELSILSSTPAAVMIDRWLALKLGFCEQCGETNVLAIDSMTRKVDGKGNVTITDRPFVPYHCISKGEMRTLRQTFRR
ncbi:MAG: hypothetical protein J0L92_27135 [Deltaproteobacteria bacterium]|nr:hypothetical protein [Deltaproteobacteria bacterium]